MGKPLAKIQHQRRIWNLKNQEDKYPDFWPLVRKLLPGISENKQLILADLIRLYIESATPQPIQDEIIEESPDTQTVMITNKYGRRIRTKLYQKPKDSVP